MAKKTPYLASPLTDEVVAKAERAIALLRSDPGGKNTPRIAVEAIHDITEVSLKFYFFRPMDEMRIGLIGANITKMGVNAGLGLLNTFGARLLKSLSDEQRRGMADYIAGGYLMPQVATATREWSSNNGRMSIATTRR